ncbi:MAG: aminoglycoside phosphotransferase family protein [Labedaea sp.]
MELCKRFNARAERTLPARYGFVVVASTPNGPLVLRASPDPAGKVQAEVSRALAKVGAGPAIHEVVVTNTGTWIAMEQIEPGIALDRATLSFDLLCRVRKFLHKLYEQPTPVLNMRGIDQWLRERLLDDHLTDVASGQFSVSAGERSQALDILDDLAAGPAGWNLCHGDLHAGNIIERADGRLFLIDPRGVSGEITYDVAVLALKAAHNSPVAARPLAVQFAAFVGLDAARAEAWVRVAAAARV